MQEQKLISRDETRSPIQRKKIKGKGPLKEGGKVRLSSTIYKVQRVRNNGVVVLKPVHEVSEKKKKASAPFIKAKIGGK